MKLSLQSADPSQEIILKGKRVYRLLEDFYGIPQWRQPLSPMDELISTILSQNTNDTNRDAAFNNLKARYKGWEEVRDAPLAEVQTAIRTAGLANQKAPRMQQLLRQISAERGSLDLDFLRHEDREKAHAWLSRFNGVGPKTAAIVLQFSLGIPAFPVDTHIYRVTGRLGLRPLKMNVEKAHVWLEKVFKPEQYGPGHLNIICLGREICHARKPECNRCPLRDECDFYKNPAI